MLGWGGKTHTYRYCKSYRVDTQLVALRFNVLFFLFCFVLRIQQPLVPGKPIYPAYRLVRSIVGLKLMVPYARFSEE